jgi:hypothetical protein
MSVQYHDHDILHHISTETPAPQAETSLEERAAFSSVCVNLVSFAGATLAVCLDLAGGCVTVSAKLKTPIGDIELGRATICPDRPCITLGGGLGDFKAELKACLVLQPLAVDLTARVCAPFIGCKTVSVRIPLGAEEQDAGAAEAAETLAPVDDVKVFEMSSGKLAVESKNGNDQPDFTVAIAPVKVHRAIDRNLLYAITGKGMNRRVLMKFDKVGIGGDYYFRQARG